MITLSKGGAYLIGGTEVVETGAGSEELLKNKLGINTLQKKMLQRILWHMVF